MDLINRTVDFITANSPNELRTKLFKINVLTGKMTEVIQINVFKGKWFAWFYIENNQAIEGLKDDIS